MKKKVNNQNDKFSIEIEETINKWNPYIEFENIGVVCGKQMEKGLAVLEKIRRIDRKTTLLIIGKDDMLIQNKHLEYLVSLSPSRLCVILSKEWKKSVSYIEELIKASRFRYLKSGNNPVGGIRFLLVSSQRRFIIDMYQHVKCNPLVKKAEFTFLSRIGAEYLFQEDNQKYMPVLACGKIFKCRNAFRLWRYWNERMTYFVKNLHNTERQVLENEYYNIMENSVANSKEEIFKLRGFMEYSKICDLCCGCIECIVFPKNDTNR